jgi:hypothetical protein
LGPGAGPPSRPPAARKNETGGWPARARVGPIGPRGRQPTAAPQTVRALLPASPRRTRTHSEPEHARKLCEPSLFTHRGARPAPKPGSRFTALPRPSPPLARLCWPRLRGLPHAPRLPEPEPCLCRACRGPPLVTPLPPNWAAVPAGGRAEPRAPPPLSSANLWQRPLPATLPAIWDELNPPLELHWVGPEHLAVVGPPSGPWPAPQEPSGPLPAPTYVSLRTRTSALLSCGARGAAPPHACIPASFQASAQRCRSSGPKAGAFRGCRLNAAPRLPHPLLLFRASHALCNAAARAPPRRAPPVSSAAAPPCLVWGPCSLPPRFGPACFPPNQLLHPTPPHQLVPSQRQPRAWSNAPPRAHHPPTGRSPGAFRPPPAGPPGCTPPRRCYASA